MYNIAADCLLPNLLHKFVKLVLNCLLNWCIPILLAMFFVFQVNNTLIMPIYLVHFLQVVLSSIFHMTYLLCDSYCHVLKLLYKDFSVLFIY